MTKAILKVHMLFQNLPFSPRPYKLNPERILFQENLKYKLPVHFLSRKFKEMYLIAFLAITASRLFWLFLRWDEYSRKNLTEGMFYVQMCGYVTVYTAFY